ncbi:MAG TPA: hypothetical protein VJ915_04570 [Balneolaceae bacterium]|nr:hypothetical protein [Balneolaceae bacterium]
MMDYAIFELVAVILAVPFSYLMAKLVKYYSRPNYRNEVDTDFQKEWNGRPDDEYEAWIRLRRKYLRQDVPGKYLDHIKMRLSAVNKRDHLSNLSVNEKGDIYRGNVKDPFKNSESDSN